MRLRTSRGLSLIGLAVRAGRVESGEFCTEKEIRSGRAKLVIVAGDASDNTKKKFQDLCTYKKVPLCIYQDKDTLGHAMGKEFRASLAILDTGLAQEIIKAIKTEDPGDEKGGNAYGENQDL